MKHTPASTTHIACNAQLEKYGASTVREWMESMGFHLVDGGDKSCWWERDNPQMTVDADDAAFFYDHEQATLAVRDRLYQASDNMHEAVRGIDEYRKFKGSDDEVERMAAWINQLSKWNLSRGVQALREMKQQAFSDGYETAATLLATPPLDGVEPITANSPQLNDGEKQ
jgi:hypothetical protein